MGRKLSCLFLTTILIFSLSLPAYAAPGDTSSGMETVTIQSSAAQNAYAQTYQSKADVEYSGPLDPQTGLPAANASSENASYVTLREGSFGYDKDRRCYVNEVAATSFTSNIPNGAILSSGKHTVSFSIPSGLSASLYRDGDLLAGADLSGISEVGAYILEVAVSNSYHTVSFSFQILDEMTNAVTEFSLPAGFTFESVMLEGELLTPDYKNYTQIIEDGAYEISWSNQEIGQRYSTSFTLDTVSPVLELPEVVDGEANTPVTLTDLEPDAFIVLKETKTGETKNITSSQTEVTDAGTYHLTVYDTAGNTSEYDFTIHVYLDFSAFAAIGLSLAGVLSLALYSRYIKKHPRVG